MATAFPQKTHCGYHYHHQALDRAVLIKTLNCRVVPVLKDKENDLDGDRRRHHAIWGAWGVGSCRDGRHPEIYVILLSLSHVNPVLSNACPCSITTPARVGTALRLGVLEPSPTTHTLPVPSRGRIERSPSPIPGVRGLRRHEWSSVQRTCRAPCPCLVSTKTQGVPGLDLDDSRSVSNSACSGP